MKFNFRRLKQYVRHGESVGSLCDLLNSIGLEVEEVVGPGPELDGLVVGEVIKKAPHPNADKLTLCRVDVGSGAIAEIVCGAANHFEGAKVVVALPGTTLAGGLRIEKCEIRGVPSEGMMCSIKELGLGDDHEGVILLPEDAEPGASPVEYLTCVELSVTPNRPDCLAWIGIAREIAAATGAELLVPESSFPSESSESIPIALESPAGCPRYIGRIIRGVTIGPSPKWLQDSLREIGLTPINNVVDVTNFVLMERGHPLHAFDIKRLAGPEIRVRDAEMHERFTALNGNSYELSSDHLMIADRDKSVALAGTMGGQNSEVWEGTTDLLIECAYFNPSRIRRGSKSIGLVTDSSFRFERGVDPEGMDVAIDRCVGLILEVAGGRVTSSRIDAKSEEHLPKPATVDLRPEKACERIGVHIPETHQAEILRKLGCRVKEAEAGTLRVRVPGFRPDLTREIDLIEELARHYGYESIESVPPDMPSEMGTVLPVLALERAMREFLVKNGWIETKSFSFMDPERAENLQLKEDHPLRHTVRILNPIGAETSQLRSTMVVNLLETLRRNVARGERSLRLFETGNVYLRDLEDLLHCEREALCMAWLGSEASHWSIDDRSCDFFDAKGCVEALFQELGIRKYRIEPFACDYFHPSQSARWTVGEVPVAVVGRLHPAVARRFDLPESPILVEMDISAVCSFVGRNALAVDVPSPYPPIRRDLSLTVSAHTPCREVLSLLEESRTPFLERIELFDRYEGRQMGSGQQSLGFRLTYRSSERTLTEEEITPIHLGLLRQLSEKLGATQRGLDLEAD